MADHVRPNLLGVGGLLHREIAIEELLRRLVDRIARALDADRGTIYLVDHARGEVFSRVAHLPELEEIRLSLGQGVAGHVAQTGRVVNVPTTESEARFYPGVDQKTGYRTHSILAAPMRDESGRIIGVVQLLNKRTGTFPVADHDTLEALAEEASLAIQATTLHADLARTALRNSKPLPIAAQFNRIVGSAEPLRGACRLTAKAAASEATVLIRGESGTGKELFARAIHVNSPRSERPFIKVDCAALPESLIENELFGHERGAFTGADQRAIGKFELAQGGTIFLDEIGELSLQVQGKLLRVLQDREFDRVGGLQPVKADVRVVAATNRDLERLVEEGRFRGDLYYRIRVVQIQLPSLRERGPEDITRLAYHFAEQAGRRHGKLVPKLSEGALALLVSYPWPGNVRELENCLESAVVIMDDDTIHPGDLPLPTRPLSLTALHHGAPGQATTDSRPATDSKPATESKVISLQPLAEVERHHILGVLEQVDGNRTLAARVLGIGRNTLGRKLREYGL